MIYQNKRILSWKQKFDGDIDNDESINYVIPPPKPHLITNTDSGLTLALILSGKAYRDASVSSTNDEGTINSLNSDVLSDNFRPCFVLRRRYTSNNRNVSNIRTCHKNKYLESLVCISIVLIKGLPEFALPIRLQFNEIMSRKIYVSIGWRIE